MKQTKKRPLTGASKKIAGTIRKNPAKTGKKKGRKPGPRERLRAVVIAASLIAAAAAVLLTVSYLRAASPPAIIPPGPEVSSLPEAAEAGDIQAAPEPVQTAPEPVQAAEEPAQEPFQAAREPGQEPFQAAQKPVLSDREPVTVNREPVPAPPVAVNLKPTDLQSVVHPKTISRGILSFVIDDAGNNLRDLEPFLKFPGHITIAVLPGLPYSAEAARRIRAAGKEVFLHQPMESVGGTNPGPGAILTGMTKDEIREIINRNLDEIWPVAGMNNHEGSRISMDEEAMETILSLCLERGIVFLDSRTIAESAASGIARRLGMKIGVRDIFLDNDQDKASITGFLKSGLKKAEQNGSAIMIGHVWSAELAPILTEMYPDLNAGGYTLSNVSGLVNKNNENTWN